MIFFDLWLPYILSRGKLCMEIVMKTKDTNAPIRIRDLQRNIALLACVEANETPFLSAYLDLSSPDETRRFLNREAHNLRQCLSGTALGDFESAFSRLQYTFGRAQSTRSGSLALFTRGQAGGGFHLAMRFELATKNSLSLYPTPDLQGLLTIKHDHDHFMLARVGQKSMQALEVNLGSVMVRAWSAYTPLPGMLNTVSGVAPAVHVQDPVKLDLKRQVELLERLLRNNRQAPLLLSGESGLVKSLQELLPESLRARLVRVRHLSTNVSMREAVQISLKDFARHRAEQSRRMVGRLLRGMRSGNGLVAGVAASLRALEKRQAGTLVMATGYRPGPMMKAIPGHDLSSLFDPRIELIRLAAQQGIRVQIVDSDELLYLGGVACLPRPSPQQGRLPVVRGLDLVA